MLSSGERKTVFTVGYSNHSFDSFLDVIRAYGITAIADVRRFASSKLEWFKGERLAELLGKHGIKYVHFPALGGFRRGGYERYMLESDLWKKAYVLLISLCNEEVCAIMCKERNPKYCHRRYISERLHMDGWVVCHIFSKNKCAEHRDVFPRPIIGVQRTL